MNKDRCYFCKFSRANNSTKTLEKKDHREVILAVTQNQFQNNSETGLYFNFQSFMLTVTE